MRKSASVLGKARDLYVQYISCVVLSDTGTLSVTICWFLGRLSTFALFQEASTLFKMNSAANPVANQRIHFNHDNESVLCADLQYCKRHKAPSTVRLER